MHEDEHVNEHVKLSISKDKLLALLNEHGNEIMTRIMSLDNKKLDARSHG